MRYIGCILAVLLPFKHGVDVQFELEYRCDDGSRVFILHCQSSEVVLHKVMQTTQFLTTGIFQCGRFKDHANMCWMSETLATVAGLQAFNGFSIVPYFSAFTPPLFAIYFPEKEGGGRNNEDLRISLTVKSLPCIRLL